jgi:hypothetical protein
MSAQNTPKITANNSNSKKPKFFKKEVKFNSQEQLQAYLADAVVGNRRKSFNLKVQVGK